MRGTAAKREAPDLFHCVLCIIHCDDILNEKGIKTTPLQNDAQHRSVKKEYWL